MTEGESQDREALASEALNDLARFVAELDYFVRDGLERARQALRPEGDGIDILVELWRMQEPRFEQMRSDLLWALSNRQPKQKNELVDALIAHGLTGDELHHKLEVFYAAIERYRGTQHSNRWFSTALEQADVVLGSLEKIPVIEIAAGPVAEAKGTIENVFKVGRRQARRLLKRFKRTKRP